MRAGDDPIAELGYILHSLRLRAALGRARSIVAGGGRRSRGGDPVTEVLSFQAECWALVQRWQARCEGPRAAKVGEPADISFAGPGQNGTDRLN